MFTLWCRRCGPTKTSAKWQDWNLPHNTDSLFLVEPRIIRRLRKTMIQKSTKCMQKNESEGKKKCILSKNSVLNAQSKVYIYYRAACY